MADARPPRSTKSSRRDETDGWQRQWQAFRAAIARDPSLRSLQTSLAGKCAGYQYLFTIYLVTQNELLAEAISVLQIYGLDGRNWRQRLKEMARVEGGGAEDDIGFAHMRYLVEERGWTAKRAAECTVASFALHARASSWVSAVQRVRKNWIDYKQGLFRPLGQQIRQEGLFVRPNTANLKRSEIRRIIDPDTLQPLPTAGARVPDNIFWRSHIELGLVILADEPL